MRHKINTEIQRVADFYRQMPWEKKEVYADYLAQTYYYVAYSTRLLAFAAGNMDLSDDSYFKRFVSHIGEESSHEKLALSDLKGLGFRIEDYTELSETSTFYESQFYKIQHRDPICFLGYILLLETVALMECPPLTKKIEKLYGQKTTSFIKLHGEEDPDHVEKALAIFDSLPRSRGELIFKNLKQSADNFINILQAIIDRQMEGQTRRAA